MVNDLEHDYMENNQDHEVKLLNVKAAKTINDTLFYYTKNALRYKRIYYTVSIFTIILNCSIPILVQMESMDIVITFVAILVAGFTSISTLVGFHDKWYRYRESAEVLHNECFLYTSEMKPYSKNNTDREKLFILKFLRINARYPFDKP